MQVIDFQSNQISFLPSTTEELKELRELYMSHNQFMQFPHELRNMKKLEVLDLGTNQCEPLCITPSGSPVSCGPTAPPVDELLHEQQHAEKEDEKGDASEFLVPRQASSPASAHYPACVTHSCPDTFSRKPKTLPPSMLMQDPARWPHCGDKQESRFALAFPQHDPQPPRRDR